MLVFYVNMIDHSLASPKLVVEGSVVRSVLVVIEDKLK